jgi:hypothetical protein
MQRFPTMNTCELVDHIRSGPAELVLVEPLRFRRRTRSNPYNFNEFLQALQSSETIRTVECGPQLQLGISEHEWVLLTKTLGIIRDIQNLTLHCTFGSGDFHPFQAVADALNNAQSLCKLIVDHKGRSVPGDSSGLTALANALQEHTHLQIFGWIDLYSQQPEEAAQITAIDPVLWALPACPHLQKITIMTRYATVTRAMKNLLHIQSTTYLHLRLVLSMSQGLVLADEIRRGRCNVRSLTLIMLPVTNSDGLKAVKAVASAIRLDCNLEHLTLEVEEGFTEEACVALAEALTVNKTLCKITLRGFFYEYGCDFALGDQAYEAFSAMLRVNTNLVLELPPFETDSAAASESCKEMVIEQRLNQVGRGKLLSSSQTTREEWLDALHEMSLHNADDSPTFQVSCLYSLLRLHPAVCMLS